ncbi:galactose-1-phosphate uridylyltransferase [Methanocrinis sp.]|uniref:galactose-1-phosphate uridylyltransferase n=1 Tax=Methanocrinis sp. TaxID=3101522 RepID=UPI003D09E1B8
MRRHYFLGDYCIIAAERGKRPSDFKHEGTKERSDPNTCPFCPGNEEMTPPAVAVYTDDGIFSDGEDRVKNWWARSFQNLYPAATPKPEPPTKEWVAEFARGGHEVIVESPDHKSDPARFSRQELERLVLVYRDRYSRRISQEGVAYVSIFKNWGRVAGASISHTHSQLIALPIVPPALIREMDTATSAPRCPYCSLAEREATSERLIFENEGFVLIAPFCSQVPYETWILPRKHLSSLEELDRADLQDLGQVLGEALRRLDRLLSGPPYNYSISQLPDRRYHLNIRIQPAISTVAGFEKNTGIFINTVPPEEAARDLREV